MKIFNGKKESEKILAQLKRKIKTPKKVSKKIEDFKDYDDIRVVVYSQVKKTGIKKTPDIKEIGLCGSLGDKLKFVQDNFHKEILTREQAELLPVVGSFSKDFGF